MINVEVSRYCDADIINSMSESTPRELSNFGMLQEIIDIRSGMNVMILVWML